MLSSKRQIDRWCDYTESWVEPDWKDNKIITPDFPNSLKIKT